MLEYCQYHHARFLVCSTLQYYMTEKTGSNNKETCAQKDASMDSEP